MGVTLAELIGAPDLEWGEVVKAVVILHDGFTFTLEEAIDHTKTQLASYKAPSYLSVVDSLPRNHMGKVLKNDLRKTHGEAKNG